MKLMHPLFSAPIPFQENVIPVLVIENPIAFRKLATDLVRQSEGTSGEFVLSIQDKPVDCAGHLNVFYDYCHLGTLEKRMQTRALNALIRNVYETMPQETFRFSQIIQEYLGRLATLAEYPVAYEQSENLNALLKAMDFHVDLEGLPACEALYEQMSLIHRLTKGQCFALINAKSFLSMEELHNLYKMTQYQKMNLMLLESRAPKPLSAQEKVILFDEDLCEIVLDSRDEMG